MNEDYDSNEIFDSYINHACSIFGGLEICALDLVHDRNTDSMIILELNGTAIGLVQRHELEDMQLMRDLVIVKMSKIYSQNEKYSVVDENESKDNVIVSNIHNKNILMNEEEKLDGNGMQIQLQLEENDNNEQVLLQAIAKIRELEAQQKVNKKIDRNKKDCIVM